MVSGSDFHVIFVSKRFDPCVMLIVLRLLAGAGGVRGGPPLHPPGAQPGGSRPRRCFLHGALREGLYPAHLPGATARRSR